MSTAITRVSDSCHTCASLKKFPGALASQSSDDPLEVVGLSFAADVIRRCRQLILLLRETTSSYTMSCIVPDEKSDTLRDALTRLVVGLHPLDGPQAVIRVDPATGFVSLKNTNALQHLGVSFEVGRIKNINKNPVAEKAVQELEEELLRQEPGEGPVTEVGLVVATARLNARLRNQGLSSRELWTQRNQFSNEQIPLSDLQHIMEKHTDRQTNHPFSEQAKGGRSPTPSTTPLQVGNLVYVKADRDKSRVRDRYIIVSIDGEWCFIKTFSGSQLRATSYKVKPAECYSVPSTIPTVIHPLISPAHDDDECDKSSEPPLPCQPLSTPQDLVRPHSPHLPVPASCQTKHADVGTSDDTSHVLTQVPTSPPLITPDFLDTPTIEPRPKRTCRPPNIFRITY